MNQYYKVQQRINLGDIMSMIKEEYKKPGTQWSDNRDGEICTIIKFMEDYVIYSWFDVHVMSTEEFVKLHTPTKEVKPNEEKEQRINQLKDQLHAVEQELDELGYDRTAEEVRDKLYRASLTRPFQWMSNPISRYHVSWV